jgi:hypothetical protein
LPNSLQSQFISLSLLYALLIRTSLDTLLSLFILTHFSCLSHFHLLTLRIHHLYSLIAYRIYISSCLTQLSQWTQTFSLSWISHLNTLCLLLRNLSFNSLSSHTSITMLCWYSFHQINMPFPFRKHRELSA